MTQQGFTNYPTTNGRIYIISPTLNNQFELSDKIPVHTTAAFRDAMTGNWMNTPLSLAYFSSENINILQNNIRKGVFDKSNGEFVIGLQDEDELKIIMRAMFIQYAKYRTDIPITIQVQEINRKVLEFSVPRIISSLNMKRKYLNDIQKLPVPLEHSRSMSTKGTKELELKEF